MLFSFGKCGRPVMTLLPCDDDAFLIDAACNEISSSRLEFRENHFC